MNYYTISALVNFILSSTLGLVVFLKNPKSRVNLTFSFFACAVAFWSFSYYFWQIAESYNSALFWTKTLMSFAIFIPVFYLHFVFAFLGILNAKKILLIATYLIFFLFFLLNIFTSQFITGVKPLSNFAFWPIPGIFFHPFLIIWAVYVIYATQLLYRTQRDSIGLKSMQSKYILMSMIIGFIGGSTNYFFWYGVSIPPLGNILVSVYVAMTAYAIVKHRLFDIRLIIARSVAYTLLLVVLGALYAGGLFVIGTFYTGVATADNQLAISTLLALMMAFTFQPLRHYLEKITDKIFFKGHYDSSQLLSNLSSVMSMNIEFYPLTTGILQYLTKDMRITRGAIVVLSEDSKALYDVIGVGFSHPLLITYSQVSPLISSSSDSIILDELDEGELKEQLKKFNASLLRKLRVKERVIGFLLLGEKASGGTFSEQDLKIIDILAPEAAVAIHNSQSYDKIKRFNVILSEEVKRATSDLQKANIRLQELDKLKDDFVSVASHELRTPMTAIRSYAWMAIHRSDMPLSQKLQRYLYRVLLSTERLINLVNDMLNLSRIEAGKIEITPRPFDILEFMKDIIDEIKPKADEKRIEIIVLEHKLPDVFADPDKIHEVILNLLGNSLKFTYPGGNITIDFFTDGKMIETSVKDNGSGIDKEDLNKLFRKFGRLDNSFVSMSTSGGTGLGLYISKSLVERMGGRIWVQSEGMDKGATFTFSLPIATDEILKNADLYRIRPKGEAKPLEPVAL